MVKIVIQETLDESWRSVVEREVNLTLGSARESGRQFRIQFGCDTELRTGETVYRCNVLVDDLAERAMGFEARHSDGAVAVRNAVNRARRDLVRRSSFARSPAMHQE